MTPRQWAEYQRQADVIEQEQKRIKNMTAVEWLIFEYTLTGYMDEEMIEKAKQMEQSQIEEAFYSGNQIPGNWDDDSTNYYNETFNK